MCVFKIFPRCCCAEWVDEGLSVHVKFNVPNRGTDDPLLANDIFVHYFAESELDEYNEHNNAITDKSTTPKEQVGDVTGSETAPFDGLSCKAFKLDKLKMGQQAQRIAAFEKAKKNSQ